MSFNWSAPGYREIVNDYLGYRSHRRPRGVVKRLADRLRCHPTFIAQVFNGRAEFSVEQGYEICHHFMFSPEEREFFLNLLMRDRAGTSSLKKYYQSKLDRALEERRDLKPKTQGPADHPGPVESEYFGSWIYQVIHAMTQIGRLQSAAAIAKALNRSAEEVTAILGRLREMNLVKNEKSAWKSTLDSLHLPKSSHFVRYLHTTWKAKILSDLQGGSEIEGTRFSGLITVSEKDYQKVRDVLVKAINDVRRIVESSPPEKVCVLSVDCYKL